MLTDPLGERAFVEGMTMHVVAVAQLIEEAMPYLSKNKVRGGLPAWCSLPHCLACSILPQMPVAAGD